MWKNYLLVAGLFLARLLDAQNAPFGIYLEPVQVPGLSGLQSYAFGTDNGKWLIIGGRLDGLHLRQPFAAFDVTGNNTQLLVVDPALQQQWAAPLISLPVSVQEQLSSTNMEFHQDGNYLYLIGGYGYNAATASRKTFDYLTAVDVPAVINAVINSTPFTSYFRQISDPLFAVTGGHLEKINSTYYLACGNRFDGNYNPMGNPTYTQVYTDAVRRFTLSDNGTTITITHLPALSDAANFHRRDYNAVAQILPDGSEGITVFSGVFQPTVNLPFLHSVTIDSAGYTANAAFQQHYNHYHCAALPVYSASANEMHMVFFGGIAQFYDSASVLVQDNNVPFVKTIARVTRDANGNLNEYKLPVDMPAYLGAGSEFIHAENLPVYPNHVIQLDNLQNDTTLAGYIFGGISSTAPNIFFTNNGSQSSASSQIYKVYILRNAPSGTDQLNTQSSGNLLMEVYPNPAAAGFSVKFSLHKPQQVGFKLFSADGRLIDATPATEYPAGNNQVNFGEDKLVRGGVYMLEMQTESGRVMRKVIVRR